MDPDFFHVFLFCSEFLFLRENALLNFGLSPSFTEFGNGEPPGLSIAFWLKFELFASHIETIITAGNDFMGDLPFSVRVFVGKMEMFVGNENNRLVQRTQSPLYWKDSFDHVENIWTFWILRYSVSEAKMTVWRDNLQQFTYTDEVGPGANLLAISEHNG